MCATPQGPNDQPIRTALAVLMSRNMPQYNGSSSMAVSGQAPQGPALGSRMFQQRRQAQAPGS